MKAVIMAGGKGTRLASVAGDLPKPMVKIDGMPVLEHAIRCLKRQGFTDILLTAGYRWEAIRDYFGEGDKISPATGEPFGVRIAYYIEEEPLGNAGALFQIRERLAEDFLLVNGDVVFDVDFKRFVQYHKKKGGLATLFTHPNSHPYDSGLVTADRDGMVLGWSTKEEGHPQYYRNRVNAGLHILSTGALDLAAERLGRGRPVKADLDRDILKPLAGTGRMYCYDSPEYVKDMGTPERYAGVCRDLASGKVQARNLANRQKAVFLDRDGTINRYIGFLTDIEKLELLPGVAEAVRRINDSGYLAIVVTNQPVIARGETTEEGLENIHNKMETLLGSKGAYLDAIYYCPHHPDKGYAGEVAELKVECACRKPKPGMLLTAAERYNIDLTRSWMAGDGENDILAGKAAGCRTALVTDEDKDFGQDITAETLLVAVERMGLGL